MHLTRSKLAPPIVVLILTLAAIAAVWILVGRADSSRRAQLQINTLALSVSDLQNAPFSADPASGGSPKVSQRRIDADETMISRGLMASSQAGVSSSLLAAARSDLARLEPVVTRVYRTAIAPGGLVGAGDLTQKLNGDLQATKTVLAAVLTKISRTDAARSADARMQAKLGTMGAMLLLLTAFSFFYFRSITARAAVERLAREKDEEARTDALTDLSNRRALGDDFAGAVGAPSEPRELLLVMFDLDGFKEYNDTFGHPAGDALLHRLGGRLAAAAALHSARAYRMGGDEFCVLARCSPDNAERLLEDVGAALHERGEGWNIACSEGTAWIPSEATTESHALALADKRMYANKASRSSARRQVSDALLQVIAEQNGDLDAHVERVTDLAGPLAQRLGLPEHEVQRIRLAARLHDVGKTAIPAAILDKPGPFTTAEWAFVHRHPSIGARIVSAAPALANTAELIHASHERFDGHGYPDGLTGEEIPLGSRIIAACDAFEAMTSDRVYASRIGTDAALAELERNSGTQFDATVVEALCKQIRSRAALSRSR